MINITFSEQIFELVIIILIAILFNFYPHRVGANGIINGKPWYMPLLAPVFSTYLPWWNLYWLLVIGMNFVLLKIGRWTRTTHWIEFSLMIFSGILVYWILTGPSILGVTPEYLAITTLDQRLFSWLKKPCYRSCRRY